MAEKLEFDLITGRNGLSKALGDAQGQATALQKSLDVTKDFIKANVVIAAVDGIGSALKGSVKDAREFSRATAEINSILPKNAKLTDQTTQSFIELSKQYGTEAQNQAKAFYNIVSAGVQGTAKQLEVLKTANEAATAGLVDINTSATVLVSSVNAYAASGLTAKEASDSLFQAVKDGQTTFNELAASLGQVAPLASSAGVTFQDLNGTIAFLTASGIKTPQAITGIRAALTSIIKPTQEAKEAANSLGIEFGVEGIKNAGGFAQFLGKVREATGGSTAAISKLFGSVEATNAVLAVAGGNFSKFTELIDNNRKSLGATAEAATEVKKSLDFQLGQLEAEGKALALTFGNLLVPAIQQFASGLKLITNQFRDNNDEFGTQREKLAELGVQYNATAEAIRSVKKSIAFTEAGGLQASEESLARLAALEEKRNKILKERQALRTFITAPARGDGETSTTNSDAEIKAEQEKSAQLIQLAINRDQTIKDFKKQSELDALNSSQELANQEIQNEFTRNEAELQRLIEFDTLKKELEFSLAEERANLISDEGERKLEIQRIAAQRELEFTKIANANLIKENANRLKSEEANLTRFKKFEELTASERVSLYSSTFGQIASLASSNNKTLATIGKAAAISQATVDGTLAVQKTLASLPYPANIAAAALVGVSTAANVAKIAGVQFENGGVVGGMNGASIGGDNRQATIRDGEVVLNATQQKNLMDMLNNGGSSGDIVVQIDGREIFRAVRNQLNQGMKLI